MDEEMQAGSVMDAAIAELVMGWRRDENDHRRWPQEWHPSTDIAAAMNVVARLRELEWKIQMRSVLEDAWEVTLDRGPHDTEVHFVETLPLAICQVALKAVALLPIPSAPA
jgi:hypothetical protein